MSKFTSNAYTVFMKKFFSIILSLFFFSCSFFHKEDLRKFKWKNRILIIIDKEANTIDEKIKKNYSVEFEDRDLLIIKVIDNKVFMNNSLVSHSLKESVFSIIDKQAGNNNIILIGKDGKVKHKYFFNHEISQILDDIDSMPMRIREMNE